MNLAIETKGLTRRFGAVCAVDGLDLQVERGKFYGFLGPNGAGKSTTIKMLTGLLAPTDGSITILGEDTRVRHNAREIKRRIGVVPENLSTTSPRANTSRSSGGCICCRCPPCASAARNC
jgi:ABC-2 type transport system ATP-binding protein